MLPCFGNSLLFLAILSLALSTQDSQALMSNENGINSAVFLSPMFVMGPGSVVNKYYHNIDFPKGHIALKSFDAEVVDEAGEPVPLHETYLHHWVVARYYQRKDAGVPAFDPQEIDQSDSIFARNSGICQRNVLGQYFGLGSETRKTATFVPDPYGIEIGNPMEIPIGYEEKWMLNVHAIDTRGVEDRLGCTECRCDLYNITKDEYGRPLKPDYKGGLHCCYDQTQCRVKKEFDSASRNLYMKYIVKWVDWDNLVVPVKIYIFDVTDTWKKFNDPTGLDERHNCLIEYEVELCSAASMADYGCIDTKRSSLTMQTGGYVIYGVAHQHSGGIGSALYGEDGRVICSSIPTYGKGKEAGNEDGYIVGMSTCYPRPDSIKISDGETLVLESNYSRIQNHTGVMGLFYILVADHSPEHIPFLEAVAQGRGGMKFPISVWVVAFLGVAVAVAVGVGYLRRHETEDGYQSIVL
ncbi:uncharacterized protein LOC131159436 [Malania oleifera]|uniref:uncharacterized protein LOC131159436 n=1 Tax=Malania oleifera TaxID=397392 RepID=UPI0025AEA56A|nr:uncharacterized protein LOC131159436 [Malania oleifera]XP_057970322.1 uncharacterized protein LOC131159436 [Malania oleifera]XP_057970323.1 uncharacterized protein LOC131159436 [Malania oleifera]XP_057970324.1 uncharacterized protein LOC131159436 [Malania oleifera]